MSEEWRVGEPITLDMQGDIESRWRLFFPSRPLRLIGIRECADDAPERFGVEDGEMVVSSVMGWDIEPVTLVPGKWYQLVFVEDR